MIEFEGLDEPEAETGADADLGSDGDGPEGDPGERRAQFAHDKAREGIEHLQAAAREIIAAARAALDVAEDLVDDPDAVASLAGMAGNVTGVVSDLVRSVVPGRRPATSRSDDPSDEDDDDSKVRRIQVS